MKVGDLVELSSYGKKRKYNTHLFRHNYGLVENVSGYGAGPARVLDYRILWGPEMQLSYHWREELKFLKQKT